MHFTLRTDHQALTYLFTQRDVNDMMAGWLDMILDYSFDVHYTPGLEHVLPDTLSRVIFPSENEAGRPGGENETGRSGGEHDARSGDPLPEGVRMGRQGVARGITDMPLRELAELIRERYHAL